MKTIHIQNKDLGFWTQEHITVQRFIPAEDKEDEPELVWCNHDGAEEEELTNHVPVVDGYDMEWSAWVLICDKCPAQKFVDHDDGWDGAPFEGVFDD